MSITYQTQSTGGLMGMHALTALHPGSGAALDTVDLPVQRERHTFWPNIAGSALKGVLRDLCREHLKHKYPTGVKDEAGKEVTQRRQADEDQKGLVAQLFGTPKANAEHAGALVVTDARLLAFPVRSLRGVFAWVTCPAVVERLRRDASLLDETLPSVDLSSLTGQKSMKAMVPSDCPCVDDSKYVLLEEFNLEVIPGDPTPLATWIAENLLPADDSYVETRKRFVRQLLVVTDDDFTHFVRYATEVTARIALDYETKTTRGKALFYQEFLPTETLMYSTLLVNHARAAVEPRQAGDMLKDFSGFIGHQSVLQVGGDETTGKGFCAVRLKNKGATE